LSALVVTAIFTEETLVRETPSDSDEEGAAISKPPPLTPWEIIMSPSVPLILYTYAHVMMLAFAYTAISPLYWYTPVELGGLGFNPLNIALFMALGGFAQAIWVLVVFPPLQNRIGTNGVLRWCGTFYPFFFALCPTFSILLREGLTTVFWVMAPPILMLGSGVSMSFTAIQLALNDVSPNPLVLGTLNAIALSLVTGVRAVSPGTFSSLFAIGARTQWLWGYSIWVVLASLAAGFTVVSRYLPDYAELKRERDRKRMERILASSSTR